MSTRSLCCLRYSWPFYRTEPSFFLFWLILSSLQLFTSYLSAGTSAVFIPPHLSPSSSLTCRVPQGSVLGPILFNLYTSPLSTLISSSTISHLLYADDTQLCVSFTPKNVTSVISDYPQFPWKISTQLPSQAYLYQNHWQNSIIRSPLSLSSATHIQTQNLRSLFPKRFSASLELSSHQTQVFLSTNSYMILFNTSSI